MKILMITPYLGSIYGGTSKVITELVKEISQADINIEIITTNANSSEKLKVPLNRWISDQSYKVQYFPCWHRNDFIISYSMIAWLLQNVRNYDLIHTNTMFAPIISTVQKICKFQKIPYIITPHGMLDPWALSYKAWKKKLYYTLVENSALENASGVHCLAQSEADSVKLLNLNPRIFVIPNGVHCQEFEVLPDRELFYENFPVTRDKTIILFLGRIDPKKGLDLLATAFGKVHRLFPQTQLVVAGPDSIGFLPQVEKYFDEVGCLDAVTFTGMLTGSVKYAALSAASLYVAPSYSEGFSMSVLEGMASGLPCVITTGCNFPEAAEAKAALVVDIDADAIANALIECLAHPEQAKAMGDRAREFIFQNYTWEQSAKKLVQVYQTIITN